LEFFNNFVDWLNDNESALSAFAALVVTVGVVLSPLGAGLRGLFSTGNKRQKIAEPIALDTANPETANLETANLETPSPTAKDSPDTSPPPNADKPSIAVLPFVNMSDDKSQEYFADGMTEDIITGLSCDSRLFVVARNSTFAYKGQSPDIRAVGNELGVRYVLEGSIRPVGERLRITMQLIETSSGMHIWADKIDRPTTELFDVMDEVVEELVTALCANLGVAESHRIQRQRPEDMQAWALCVQADVLYFSQPGAKSVLEAEKLARRATEIEPGFALSWALLSYVISARIAFGLNVDLAKDCTEALALVSKALEFAPNDPTVLGYCGYASIWAGRPTQAIAYLERSLAINPNNSNVQISYGAALWAAGKTDAGVAQLELFISRARKDPFLGLAYLDLSLCYLVLGNFEKAKEASLNVIKHSPGFTWGYLTLTMSLTAMGRDAEAQAQLQKVHELEPDFTRQHVEDFLTHSLFMQEQAEKMIAQVRQAWRD
jgi:TolB-like protein/Tfp pilus assembly protein PilF